MASANETALNLLRSLAEAGFWGNLTLKFQRGNVVHITKEESIETAQPVPNYRRPNRESISQ